MNEAKNMQTSQRKTSMLTDWLNCQKALKNPKEKSKGQYGTYAKLEQLLAECLPVLNDFGFTLTQTCKNFEVDSMILETTLTHSESGETIQSEVPIFYPSKDMQKIGAAQTYARRYGLCMLLGIEGEPDSDAPPIKELSPQTTKPNPPKEFKISDSTAIPFGKFKGKSIKEVGHAAALEYFKYLEAQSQTKGEKLGQTTQQFLDYLKATETKQTLPQNYERKPLSLEMPPHILEDIPF